MCLTCHPLPGEVAPALAQTARYGETAGLLQATEVALPLPHPTCMFAAPLLVALTLTQPTCVLLCRAW